MIIAFLIYQIDEDTWIPLFYYNFPIDSNAQCTSWRYMKGKYTQGHHGGGSNLKKSKLIYIEHISHQLLYPIIPVLIQPFECIHICRLQKPSTSPKATLWAYIIGIWNVKTTLFLENSNHHSAMKFILTGAPVEKGGAAGREEWIIFSRCTNNLSNRIDSIDLWLHVKLVQYQIVW